MEIKCRFGDLYYLSVGTKYRCYVCDQLIPENCELKFIGEHKYGKSNKEVIYVRFKSCTVTKVPQGLTKIFPNLQYLDIWSSKLKKISKKDLVEYKHLIKFSFYNNEIEFLPANLFDGFVNLKEVDFQNNKLKLIAPNIFDGLEKLEIVYLSENPNYGKYYTANDMQQLKADLSSIYNQNSELYASFMQTGIVDDLEAYIQDEMTKDFKIIIDNREFKVHKFLLIFRSPTLAEILKSNPQAENFNLIDISVDIFEIILKFLYTDEFSFYDDETNFLHLFAAAGKLKIKELKEFAANKVIKMITEENALDILKLSNKYDHDEMRFRAFEKVKKKFKNANLNAEFAVDMDKLDKLVEVVKRKAEIEKEIEKMTL